MAIEDESREITKPDANVWNKPHDIKRRQLIRELESIYHKHGWPCKPQSQTVSSQRFFRHPGDELDLTSYNRKACADDLRKWMASVMLREHEEMEDQRRKGWTRMNASREGEVEWKQQCEDYSAMTLRHNVKSWYMVCSFGYSFGPVGSRL